MVSYCPRCGKRVFFAERKSSLGKDWHWTCLKCEACNKVLNPGQHAERKGIPYCEVPCYKSLFGPKLYGFGSTVESHTFNSSQEDHIAIEESDALGSNTVSNNYNRQTSTTSNNLSMEVPRIDGRPPKLTPEQITSLREKCDVLNKLHPENFIDVFEKDSSVTLEGSLRVHWGVQTPIRFKRDNSRELTPFTKRVTRGRVSKSRSFHQVDLYEDLPTIRVSDPDEGNQPNDADKQYGVYVQTEDPFNSLKQSGLSNKRVTAQELLAVKMRRGQFHTIKENKKLKRRCSINGHYYDTMLIQQELAEISESETSDNFTPAFGSVTKVFVGSHHKTGEVIRKLLNKFKIENAAHTFSLYLVKQNGEMRPLRDDQSPLMRRVDLADMTARIFLMDKPDALISQKHNAINTNTEETTSDEHDLVWKPIKEEQTTYEVSSYAGLPEPVLQGFLDMFNEEEDKAVEKIRLKFTNYRKTIEDILVQRQMTEETFL